MSPAVLLDSFERQRDSASYAFAGLVEEITARSAAEVVPALLRIEAAVARGLHAAGFISYEAAGGLDPILASHEAGPLPLLWFGIFEKRTTVTAPQGESTAPGTSGTREWRTDLSAGEHAAAVARIREYIAAGDAYQVNFTLRRRFRFAGDPAAFYRDLCRSQQAPFCAFLDIGRFQLLSASPELFFRLRDGHITVRPMKGTAPRGRWWEEDEEAKERLRQDPKERAENLMIVDLLRNDLGMVAETGSVRVASLFDVETLPTLHQMTSTISARMKLGTGLAELFRAIFPCGSVTGAPKKRAMEIIRELESSPRGVYTGCIGYISPGQEAVFSVAIRTVVIDSATGTGELGVGSGITWDSRADAEFAECLAKGVFAREGRPEFQLIETILFEEGTGYFLLERHLERLRRSAAYFGFPFRADPVRQALARRSAQLAGNHKVRLLLSRRGTFAIETEPLPPQPPGTTVAATFAEARVDSRDPFLYHKTTRRDLNTAEIGRHPGCADVIFCNERGEVTEGANNNVVAKIDGALITPPLACGLLPGVFREELLEKGVIRERVILREELSSAEDVYLINSVRRWRRMRLG
ncbi:MAG: aminodeoxychorismate synthase component I [Geobacteraceae bacterium]|nr:aminodeoxychorismate synthase component I [Geobacteraceae bacterium]